MVHFNLKYKHSVSNQDIPLNHWDFIPHTHLTMSESEFSFFLKYLKLVHQISASGEAIVYNGLLEYKIEIKDSAILDHWEPFSFTDFSLNVKSRTLQDTVLDLFAH